MFSTSTTEPTCLAAISTQSIIFRHGKNTVAAYRRRRDDAASLPVMIYGDTPVAGTRDDASRRSLDSAGLNTEPSFRRVMRVMGDFILSRIVYEAR